MRQKPALRSSTEPKTLSESKRGRQSHSIDPSGETRAPVWQSERNPYQEIRGKRDWSEGIAPETIWPGSRAGARSRVGLQPLLRAGGRPVVVPAEDRSHDRRQVAEEGTIGVDDPVEADVDPAVAVRGQGPLARAGQVPDDLDLEVRRRIELDDLRGRPQRVRQLALEVLLGGRALSRGL